MHDLLQTFQNGLSQPRNQCLHGSFLRLNFFLFSLFHLFHVRRELILFSKVYALGHISAHAPVKKKKTTMINASAMLQQTAYTEHR